ncbi:hypothetical protein [Methylibium sp.]|uniref:hypothetical protein n=1 Tax=Methylibium sp. TaxID=2067992 RepID=UPI003BA92581
MALAAATVINAVAAIVEAATGYDDRTDKGFPADKARLPDFGVEAGDEPIETQTIHPGALEQHDLEVLVTVRVAAAEGLNAARDAATAAVLTALHSPSTEAAVKALGVHTWHTTNISRARQQAGEADLARVLISLRAVFFVSPAAPHLIVGAV